jgi:hypothetical protein
MSTQGTERKLKGTNGFFFIDISGFGFYILGFWFGFGLLVYYDRVNLLRLIAMSTQNNHLLLVEVVNWSRKITPDQTKERKRASQLGSTPRFRVREAASVTKQQTPHQCVR